MIAKFRLTLWKVHPRITLEHTVSKPWIKMMKWKYHGGTRQIHREKEVTRGEAREIDG